MVEVEREFLPELASAGAARSFAVTASGADTELRSTVALLSSELATNAIVHARTRFTVHVSTNDERIRIEVSDGSPEPPVRRFSAADAVSGRGLGIVEGYASRWGTAPTAHGKTVWCEIDRQAISDHG